MKKRLTQEEFIEHVRRVADKHGGQAALAKKIHVSATYMSDVLNGRRPPSQQFAAPFGFNKQSVFVSHV